MSKSTRTYLVTGATGGLGHTVTRALLEADANVIAVGSRASSLERLTSSLPKTDRLSTRVANVLDEKGVDALFDNVEELDGVVHLVGGYAGAALEDTDIETFDRMFALNATSAFLVLRAAARAFKASERSGSIVLTGSLAGRSGMAGHLAYAASKAAVASMTKSAALDLAPLVRVNAVLPGTIATSANRAAMPDADQSSWVTPEQIAATIAFLVSSQALGVSGACIEVAAAGYTPD